MEPLFRAILIANRGEIAVRIAQTCREMGIRSVAVYSEADADALHVRVADDAVLIGPPPALESYLNIDALLRAAVSAGADAVHPGYGFLAENPDFARAVVEAGLAWIGPPPDVIALLGDKVAAKRVAVEAGLPVAPGYAGEDQSTERMLRAAEEIGYPVMLKAAAGGGGKGMRAVTAAEDLPAALEGARREARSAFGDERVFLERLIEHPRHVEIQILLDRDGAGVSLGERDCSMQRRHQKVVEEAPSPVLTPDLRAAMSEDALRLARACGYRNAGTVEFLFGDDRYYFLEVNTRIQVEHPVTEMVTGIDLVRKQIEIAAGLPLGLAQPDITLEGHAFEARIYAEDPAHGFLPSTGQLQSFRPPEGAGIRNDVGVTEGSEVTPYYDPMLAKLVVHAADRPSALRRLQAALDRYAIAGPVTNLAFLRWLADQPEFIRGRAGIEFIGTAWHPEESVPPDDVFVAAALFLATHPGASAWQAGDAWRPAGMWRTFRFCAGNQECSVRVRPASENLWQVSRDGHLAMYSVGAPGAAAVELSLDGSRETFTVRPSTDEIVVESGDAHFRLMRPVPAADLAATGGPSSGAPTAPMPGTVVKIAVQAGQRVEAHAPLVVLEAMKMEHVVEAPHAGMVAEVLVHEGELVAAGSPVVTLEQL